MNDPAAAQPVDASRNKLLDAAPVYSTAAKPQDKGEGMTFSDRTLKKFRVESEEAGGIIYEDDEDSHEEDVTHFEEDDDPLTNVGDVDDDESPVGETEENA
jgi:hypothetical protein